MVSTLMHRYAAERTLRSNHTKRPVTRDLVRTHKRHGGLMVSALDSGASSPGSSPGWGVVFLGKTLYSHSASLHPGVYMGTGEFNVGGNPAMD